MTTEAEKKAEKIAYIKGYGAGLKRQWTVVFYGAIALILYRYIPRHLLKNGLETITSWSLETVTESIEWIINFIIYIFNY